MPPKRAGNTVLSYRCAVCKYSFYDFSSSELSVSCGVMFFRSSQIKCFQSAGRSSLTAWQQPIRSGSLKEIQWEYRVHVSRKIFLYQSTPLTVFLLMFFYIYFSLLPNSSYWPVTADFSTIIQFELLVFTCVLHTALSLSSLWFDYRSINQWRIRI